MNPHKIFIKPLLNKILRSKGFSVFTMCVSSFTPVGLLLSWQFFLAVLRLTPESNFSSHPAESETHLIYLELINLRIHKCSPKKMRKSHGKTLINDS